MPISALPQAPYRQDRKSFPTPLTTDVLFSETRDCNRSDFPAYGTPHPNAVKWPHHKLIFIKGVDIERNEIFEFFYAADRENQDLYNFSSGYRNIGGNREFKIVVREYVTPRAEFDASVPAFKDGMPDTPTGVFDGVSYVFFDKQQKKTDQPELDSLYVLETHTYVETALLDDATSYSAQIPDLVPDRFKKLLPRITTEHIVEGSVAVPTLTGNQIQASEDQINPNVKLVKTVTGDQPTNATLTGSRSYVETTRAIVDETYSKSELKAETGLLISQSIVTAQGDGSYIRETVKVDEWPELTSSVWHPELVAQVSTTEKFISPADVNLSDPNTSYKSINKDRTLKIVTNHITSVGNKKVFPTPFTTDVIFSEIRDCGDNFVFPEYGTPHSDGQKWPHHKLIFTKRVDIERSDVFEFFYAADREHQDLYNFSSGYRNIGSSREYKIVSRDYVTPRAEFNASTPVFQASMPEEPLGVFDGVSYVFFDKQQKKTDQPELDSLYVLETHIYVEAALLDDKISFSAQAPDLMPDKFRGLIPRIITENIVKGKATVPVLAKSTAIDNAHEDYLQASEEQINPDVKLVKTITSGRPNGGSIKLSTKRNYVESAQATIEETYSTEKLDVESGPLISQSNVTDLGNGDYIRETVKVESWPKLVSTVWNTELSTQVETTEQFIDSVGIKKDQANTSYKAINEHRSLETVTTPPEKALSEFMIQIPSKMDIALPNVLKSIAVVWSEEQAIGKSIGDWTGYANGSSYSLSGTEGSSAASSASIRPELQIEIEQPWGSNVPVTVHAFFLKMSNNTITEDQIRAKVGANSIWPVFKPQSKTIICKGVKIGVSVKASGSASVKGSTDTYMQEKGTTVGEDYDVSLNMNCVTIPPTIHGVINFGQCEKTLNVKAEADAKWVGYGNFPSINAHSEADKTVTGTVTPSSFSATTPSEIPKAGKYVMKSSVEPYNWGWAKCTAVVLDAANLR